ncbi:MAG TPA: ribosome maturation factor RimP [Gemmatimonadaceae bacterium]|nr:ribosome maturation factor RimP [Gemmatimonadaceae bacterium]
MNQALEDVVRAQLEQAGFELFELRQGGTKSRPVLDVRIDRHDGEKVTVEDCAKASRVIEARLDAGDLVAERYVLEVSSPGVERPLRNAAEWRRYVGRRATVKSEAVAGGRAEVEIVGVEGDHGGEVAVVRDAKGSEQRIPLADIREARLAFHWQR